MYTNVIATHICDIIPSVNDETLDLDKQISWVIKRTNFSILIGR